MASNQEWDDSFSKFRLEILNAQSRDADFSLVANQWLQKLMQHKYTYQFDWLGIPVIQMPNDLIVFQEIVWKTRPDLIIETGVARGGSINFWASMQDLCGINGRVVGIDIEIRDHARKAIENSKYNQNIKLIESDSVNKSTEDIITKIVSEHKKVMVILDSNHTHSHVYKELEVYSKFVSSDCYLIVLDTMTEFLEKPEDRPWGPGDNPLTAVREFMEKLSGEFTLDLSYESRSVPSLAPSGFWLKK